MKAITFDSFDAPPRLREDLPEPICGPTDITVRVLSSSLNPVDLSIVAGVLRPIAEHDFPVILGRDYAGTIEEVGSAVTEFRVGDLVYGYVPPWNPTVHAGSWAELILLPDANFAAVVPSSVPVEVAGVAPLAVITALDAVDASQVGTGQTVLVMGATGGVGSIAVQLASQRGATVIAPAQPDDATFLRDLGVDRIIDRSSDLAGSLRGVEIDALIDLVSYGTDGFDAHASLIKPGGIGVSALRAAGEATGRINVSAAPTQESLQRVTELLSTGAVRVPIQETHKLQDIVPTLARFGTSHKQGKHAVVVHP